MRAGLDTVTDDRMFGTVQPFDPFDPQYAGIDAVDPGPHGCQAVHQICDLWLAGGILQYGLALS